MNKFLEDLEMNMQKNCFCDQPKPVNDCGCKKSNYYKASLPENAVTAMAYVPVQTDTAEYEPDEALCHGTLFPNLNKPFFGGKCV